MIWKCLIILLFAFAIYELGKFFHRMIKTLYFDYKRNDEAMKLITRKLLRKEKEKKDDSRVDERRR